MDDGCGCRCKRNSERVCRLGSKLKAHRLLSNYLGPSNGGMQEPEGPLEVVVLGTTTVLQVGRAETRLQ